MSHMEDLTKGFNDVKTLYSVGDMEIRYEDDDDGSSGNFMNW